MKAGTHEFTTTTRWTGNRGDGTRSYRGYDRSWDIAAEGKPLLPCSNDPQLGGDPAKHNPEELLLAALSSCHMLWYLHLASEAGVVVHAYTDHPVGAGETLPSGAGRFVQATLHPHVVVAPGADLERAAALHHDVPRYCFIARSVNFPVAYAPTFETLYA